MRERVWERERESEGGRMREGDEGWEREGEDEREKECGREREGGGRMRETECERGRMRERVCEKEYERESAFCILASSLSDNCLFVQIVFTSTMYLNGMFSLFIM
jgi:hypothetical protein